MAESKKRLGQKPPSPLGIKQSLETIAKRIKKGSEHYNWQGGLSFEFYPVVWTDTLKESIRQRDNYICKLCGIHQQELDVGQVKKLDVHHIDYDKLNCNPINLISLCRECHMKTNFNRENWIIYFSNIRT